MRLAVAERADCFDDEMGIRWRKAAFFDAEFSMVAEVYLTMDDPPGFPENDQAQSIVHGLRQISSLTGRIVELEATADFLSRGIGAEDNQLLPREAGQCSDGNLLSLVVTDFVFDGPANRAAAQVAVNGSTTGKQK